MRLDRFTSNQDIALIRRILRRAGLPIGLPGVLLAAAILGGVLYLALSMKLPPIVPGYPL